MKAITEWIVMACLLVGCSSTPERDRFPESKNWQVNNPEFYNYNQRIDRHYYPNPDSAQLIAEEYAQLLHSRNDFPELINIYSRLSEIRLHRKNDKFGAYNYLLKAVEVMTAMEHFGNFNPYVLINIGNILYQYNSYTDAIDIYREASDLAGSLNIEHATMLAYSNIGMSYEKLIQIDSAACYYQKSHALMPDDYHTAFLYYKMNVLDTLNGKYDSAKRYFVLTNQYLDRYLPEKGDSTGMILSAELEQKNTLRAMNYFLYASVLNQMGEASQADSVRLLANRYATLSKEIVDPGTSGKKDFQKSVLTDTVPGKLEQEEIEKGKILLAKAGLMVSLRQLNHVKVLQEKNIRMLNIIIGSMVLLGIFVIAGIVILYLKNQRLRILTHQLEQRTEELMAEQQQNRELKKKLQMNDDQSNDLMEEVNRLMHENKLYLQPSLKLSDVAALTSTNTTYLSQTINRNYTNFNDYINELRVKEACRLMQTGFTNRFTINHLLETVGFTSKSAFYSTFRKVTGMSPTRYCKAIASE